MEEENSIYVGGLPYDATEDSLRRVFDLYGKVIAVKIINDRNVGGKCYGFVSFTNPRSAQDAIMDMNGRSIGGRVVRVNEVRTRGSNGRPDFYRDNLDRGRERERERGYSNRERERYRDRSEDRSIEHDRERERLRDYKFDRERDRSSDRGPHREDQDWESDSDRGYYSGRDNNNNSKDNKEEQLTPLRDRLSDGRMKGRESRDVSDSSDSYHDGVKDKLEKAFQEHDDLEKEVSLVKQKFEDKIQITSDLHKKCQKLEDRLAFAQKITSQRRSLLNKLHRCFIQVQDCTEKTKSTEKELQLLVDMAMDEIDETLGGVREGSIYANGQL